ncbi:hypothetical protein CDD80_2249 [Ophiocordyceps camponoti-rufipedis]|uniref:Uncharacterized protein n=1 Tax=Ophiocordyceps camponoti-rufipedis TaxID=2004952 RepID=A0A2C5YBX9_9HYPO|nr:hypothetical protein CDD80_2249 [Ophiocordyceps camponoti-rufipedis]
MGDVDSFFVSRYLTCYTHIPPASGLPQLARRPEFLATFRRFRLAASPPLVCSAPVRCCPSSSRFFAVQPAPRLPLACIWPRRRPRTPPSPSLSGLPHYLLTSLPSSPWVQPLSIESRHPSPLPTRRRRPSTIRPASVLLQLSDSRRIPGRIQPDRLRHSTRLAVSPAR